MKMFKNRDDQIEKAAHEWLFLITSDHATDADIDAFEAWRAENSAHGEAYAGISQIWNDLGVLARSPQGENLRLSVSENAEKNNTFTDFLQVVKQWAEVPHYAVAFVMAVIAIGFSVQTPSTSPAVIYQTTTSEVREITLSDGSIINLGALSRMEVHYTDDRRNIALRQGQAFFDVAKNPKKPFYVKAHDTVIRVLGTKFDVHLGPQDMTVGVLEGRVQVTPKQIEKGPMRTKVLIAGQIATATAAGFFDNVTIAQIKPGAWREGRLAYKEATFAKVIADANRYYSGHIVLEDDRLTDVHVTTSFDVDQIDVFLKTLPEMFAVDVMYLESGDVIIKPLKKRNTQYMALNNNDLHFLKCCLSK